MAPNTLNDANRFIEALGLRVRPQFGAGGIFDTRTERGSAKAYSIALVLVLIAALARWGLELLSPLLLPFTAFYPAVLFASYIGGFRVGIFAAMLGALIGWWAFLSPQFAFLPLDPEGWVYILTYACTCALIIWGAGSYRNLAETSQTLAARLQDEENFRRLALEELSHRLKNKVSTILSIISFPLREHQELRDEIAGRLTALSATDDLILKAQGSGASIADIVSAEFESLRNFPNYIRRPRYPTHAQTCANDGAARS